MLDDPTAALRDLLHDRLRGHERRLRSFTEPAWRRYADLLTGAFLVAVRRRFCPGDEDRAAVIRFVSSVRERYDETGHDVDPAVAESLVWAALGDRPPVPLTGAAVTAQTLLVVGLLADEGMADQELTAFLAAAEEAVASAAAKAATASPAAATEEAAASPATTSPAAADAGSQTERNCNRNHQPQ